MKTVPFTASIDLNGIVYEAKGVTPYDALVNLNLNYTQVKTKGILTLSQGNKTSSKIIYLRPLRKMLIQKGIKNRVGKDLEYLFK